MLGRICGAFVLRMILEACVEGCHVGKHFEACSFEEDSEAVMLGKNPEDCHVQRPSVLKYLMGYLALKDFHGVMFERF